MAAPKFYYTVHAWEFLQLTGFFAQAKQAHEGAAQATRESARYHPLT